MCVCVGGGGGGAGVCYHYHGCSIPRLCGKGHYPHLLYIMLWFQNKDLFPDDHYHLSTGQCIKGCTAVGT